MTPVRHGKDRPFLEGFWGEALGYVFQLLSEMFGLGLVLLVLVLLLLLPLIIWAHIKWRGKSEAA